MQAKLIDDLLDMNRLMSGNLRLDIGPVDVVATLRSAVQGLQPTAAAKGVHVEVSLNGGPILALADANRLQQVLWNLLHNAIKFTQPGGRVDTDVRSSGERVTIVVSDNGRGISPDFLPHVFERFRQQDSSSTRESAGLGLGLSIARHLIELHGGRIDAFSDGHNKGTRIVVEIPAVKTAQMPVRPPTTGNRPTAV
jgi:signal transduction histidine kinase